MYEKQIWEDRSVERPLTYFLSNNEDGSITLTPNEGNIYKEGSKTNASRMNHIEEGIAKLAQQTITNENGTAIKFPDGTMICNKRVIFNNVECTTASGTIYITAQLSLGNFAEGFSDIPVMTVSKVRHDTGWVYNTNQISKISAGYVTFATTTSRSVATFECHLIAMGRWK